MAGQNHSRRLGFVPFGASDSKMERTQTKANDAEFGCVG